MQGMLPFLTLDCYCGFHKPKASAATTCYIRKDASERFPRFSSFIFLCDLLISAPAVTLALLGFALQKKGCDFGSRVPDDIVITPS